MDVHDHFTVRAVVVGLALGTIMCFSNMYFGLQTGWISMMSLQASLLGYAVFKPFEKRLRRPFGRVENVVLQTTAVATATMPLAAGFVGIIPALGLLTTEDSPTGPITLSVWEMVFWSLGVAFFGVFFAVPLRKQTIIREKLRFPSGTATAEMISLLHQQQRQADGGEAARLRLRRKSRSSRRPTSEDSPLLSGSTAEHTAYSSPSSSSISISSSAAPNDRNSISSPPPPPTSDNQSSVALATISHHSDRTASQGRSDGSAANEAWSLKLNALLASFGVSSLYTLLSYFFPIIYNLPLFNWLTFNLIDFAAWEWYFSPSLSYIGQGIIMGLPTTLSMLLGCIVGWGILSPVAKYAGWAPGPVSDWKTGSKGWILWISLGVMIAESVVSLSIVAIRSVSKYIQGNSALEKTAYQRVRSGRSRQTSFASASNDDEEEAASLAAESEIEQEWSDTEEGRGAIREPEQDAPPDQLVKPKTTVVGLIASTILCIIAVTIVFGTDIIPIPMSILAVVVAMFLSVLAVRALGQTDLNPVSGIGKVSQVIFALVMPGGIAANLIAGGIAEAGAQQAGDLMQDLKTGHLLGASPKAQFYGQLIGSLFSAFVATGAYRLYTIVYQIPGPEFPVPTAHVWLDMSRLVNGQPLPAHVTEFVLAFSLLFAVFVLLKELDEHRKDEGWRRYIPQGIAFAIGMYNPPNFTLARVIGGFLGHAWNKYCDAQQESSSRRVESKLDAFFSRYRRAVGKVLIIIVASGFVLGEGTFSIVNMVLRAFNVPHY